MFGANERYSSHDPLIKYIIATIFKKPEILVLSESTTGFKMVYDEWGNATDIAQDKYGK